MIPKSPYDLEKSRASERRKPRPASGRTHCCGTMQGAVIASDRPICRFCFSREAEDGRGQQAGQSLQPGRVLPGRGQNIAGRRPGIFLAQALDFSRVPSHGLRKSRAAGGQADLFKIRLARKCKLPLAFIPICRLLCLFSLHSPLFSAFTMPSNCEAPE